MFPWQRKDNAPKFILLLNSLADGINVDRAALRQAGLTRLHSVSRGDKALEIIRAQSAAEPALPVDFIIYSGSLEDMGLNAFMRALAALGSSAPPVMVISGSASELAQCIAHGAAISLRRPYSMNELNLAVQKLKEQQSLRQSGGVIAPAPPAPQVVESIHAIEDLPAKEKKLERQFIGKPDEGREKNKLLWTRTGLNLLKQGEYSAAEKYLQGAVDYDPLDLEAVLGLARLHQQQNDMERSHRWQHRAGAICIATGQSERAELIFSRLPEKWQGDHELIEAQELLQEGSFDIACEAFINICVKRRGVQLHQLLARACQFTSAPEDCIHELCFALSRAGYASTARALSARMLQEEEESEWTPGGFFAAFPRLQEVWAVARFAAHALRTAS